MRPSVGVLALQGGFEPHARAIRRLGREPVLVRTPEQLARVTHLALPGGESTTLHHLLTLFGLWDAIRARHADGSLALLGTCAGAILLGKSDGTPPPRMELLDAALARNAYGRQVESCVKTLELDGAPLDCVFIRAPKFVSVGPRVRVLLRDGADPVLVASERLLAATFHPELTDDLRVHARFLALPVEAGEVQELAGRG